MFGIFTIALAICAGVSHALYEDQIGKFDWRRQLVGCPVWAEFDRSGSGDRLLVSTKAQSLAALSVTTGEIAWRRLLEDGQSDSLPTTSDEDNIYTVSDVGRVVRAWNRRTGSLKWQQTVAQTIALSEASISATDSLIVVVSDRVISGITKEGELAWSHHIEKSDFSHVTAVSEKKFVIVSLIGNTLAMTTIDNGVRGKTVKLEVGGAGKNSCVFAGVHAVCWSGSTVSIIDVSEATPTVQQNTVAGHVSKIESVGDSHVSVFSNTGTIVFKLADWNKVAESTFAEAATLAGKYVIFVGGGKISGYEIGNGKKAFELSHPATEKVPVSSVYGDVMNSEVELVLVREDCRVEFVLVDIRQGSSQSEWVREEALASVKAVEMVDLPLSESQKLIEDEFDDPSANLLASFIRRVASQVVQLQKSLFGAFKEIFLLVNELKSGSFSQVLESLRGSGRTSSGRGQPLERDYFNLRKLLVATTSDGVVFGLDSADGSVVWRQWLGSSFKPLQTSLGETTIPLFVQRSTAHYHLNGQAVAVFQDARSSEGVILVFNPIDGAVVERRRVAPISHVDLLPFLGRDHTHSLMLVHKNDALTFYPELTENEISSAPPFYMMKTEVSALSGWKLNFNSKKIEQVWTGDLNLAAGEKIIALKGKSVHQKMHSQGRVLIDRSVQYKYNNPNLVIVGSLDEVSQTLSLFLIDVVSGQHVHSARLAKVSLPVHIVHCENWIAYSYWSEKSRRTEIGIMELYEGEELSDPEKFDSLIPTKHAPEVLTQSYIYAQGVEAMAVSQTEQGLTTRSILLGLPFGGIHEVSRKFLDATRPLDLTPEMREEMMIPYMPEIPIATEDLVNYNQTVHRITGIKTAASGLESTSLMLAYGIDLFFTRLHPSGTFDILKDDFDHLLISLVLSALVIGSLVTKRLARNSAMNQAWA